MMNFSQVTHTPYGTRPGGAAAIERNAAAAAIELNAAAAIELNAAAIELNAAAAIARNAAAVIARNAAAAIALIVLVDRAAQNDSTRPQRSYSNHGSRRECP